MKQVTRSLLSLGALALIGGGVALFAWMRAAAPADSGVPGEDGLLRVAPKSIARLEVTDSGHAFRVERTLLGWDVLTPVRLAADPDRVEEVLETLGRVRAKQRFTEKDPPPSDGVMGLDDASTGVLVAWTDDEPPRRIELRLGQTSSFNRQEYARLRYDDEPPVTVMVASGTRRGLLKQASHLFDRRTLGARVDQVQRIRVEPRVPDEDRVAYTLERSDDLGAGAGFMITDPVATELDSLAARRLFEGLSGAPVSEFVTLDAQGAVEEHGLEAPDFTVTFWLKIGEGELVERRLLVGPLEEEESGEPGDGRSLVARSDQPWVGRVNALLYHALPQSLDDLKTKRVLAFERSDVRRIELKLKPAGHVALERGDAEGEDMWRLLAPEPGPAKVQKVNSILLTFAALTGTSREAEGEAARDEALLRRLGLDEGSAQGVRFFDRKGEVVAGLLLGKSEGGETFVMREGGDFVVRVPDKRLADLPLRAAELRQ